MKFDYDKLYAATHYLCALSNETNRTLDDIQLNKVLWYADALSYLTKGQPITGTSYMRMKHGPVAKRRSRIVEDLIKHERVKEGFVLREGRYVHVLDSITEPDTRVFSSSEIDLFKDVHKYVTSEVSTDQISEQSHGEIWRIADNREELPLYTVFAEKLGNIQSSELEDAKAAWAA